MINYQITIITLSFNRYEYFRHCEDDNHAEEKAVDLASLHGTDEDPVSGAFVNTGDKQWYVSAKKTLISKKTRKPSAKR